MKPDRTRRTNFNRLSLHTLLAVATAVPALGLAVLPAAAQAEEVTPHAVTPTVVAPHVLTPPPATVDSAESPSNLASPADKNFSTPNPTLANSQPDAPPARPDSPPVLNSSEPRPVGGLCHTGNICPEGKPQEAKPDLVTWITGQLLCPFYQSRLNYYRGLEGTLRAIAFFPELNAELPGAFVGSGDVNVGVARWCTSTVEP